MLHFTPRGLGEYPREGRVDAVARVSVFGNDRTTRADEVHANSGALGSEVLSPDNAVASHCNKGLLVEEFVQGGGHATAMASRLGAMEANKAIGGRLCMEV
ncbi:hypothetical protein FCV25MIE_05450 [Fagus crenata]